MDAKDKVLKVFFDEPLKEHYFREIIKKTKVSPNTVQYVIKQLIKESFIYLTEKRGNIIFYKANLDHEDFTNQKRKHNFISLFDSNLITELTVHYSPNAIIFFGSYYQGVDNSKSDIDLAIFLEKKTKLKFDFNKYEKRLHREINLHIYTDLKNIPIELRNNIINGAVLYGYLKVF